MSSDKKKTNDKDIGTTVGPVTDVTKSRHIKDAVRYMLWGKAAGRCEFSGCNQILWKNPVTQEQVNLAEAAHIYAFSVDGPRGVDGIDVETLNELDNLMLACQACHKTMDQEKDGGRYTVDLLKQWKWEHERRIERVSGIDPKKSSHVVLYGTNIGNHGSPLTFAEAAHAMFPDYYPADDRGIKLECVDSPVKDKNPQFWEAERANLEAKYEERIRERIRRGEIDHMSVFALAPQPLLVLLGSLLIDITRAEVYQRHREPRQTWDWPEVAAVQEFKVIEPGSTKGQPALVIATSATITEDRIRSVIGIDAAIWTITVPKPHNDFTKSRAQLSEFRSIVRPLLDKIKATHGQSTILSVFPVTSVSIAVELGRTRMPKADMTWRIYDQVNELGGFVPAITIQGQAAHSPMQKGGQP